MWFTEFETGVGKVGMVNLSTASVTEYPTGVSGSRPFGIAAGPDTAHLWFTDPSASAIGTIATSTGAVVEQAINPSARPEGIIAGADGNLWFCETNAQKIGVIAPDLGASTYHEYPSGSKLTGLPTNVAAGPDGNLWFAEELPAAIGRIKPDGTVTEYTIPGATGAITGIVAGPDNDIWFTDETNNTVYRFIW